MSISVTQYPNFGTASTSTTLSIGTSSGIVSGISNTIYISPISYSRKFHILGEDFELSNNHGFDSNLVIIISTLNVLKRPFWEELKKQNVYLPDDIEKFIEERLLIIDRDDKINSIIKTNT